MGDTRTRSTPVGLRPQAASEVSRVGCARVGVLTAYRRKVICVCVPRPRVASGEYDGHAHCLVWIKVGYWAGYGWIFASDAGTLLPPLSLSSSSLPLSLSVCGSRGCRGGKRAAAPRGDPRREPLVPSTDRELREVVVHDFGLGGIALDLREGSLPGRDNGMGHGPFRTTQDLREGSLPGRR